MPGPARKERLVLPMRDKAKHSRRTGEPPSRASLTVPILAVDGLREGVYAEIGSVAEALQALSGTEDRETKQERFRGLLEHLQGAYALLDAIGWTTTAGQRVSVPVRQPDVRLPLVKALDTALMLAQNDIGDGGGTDPEHTGQGKAAEDDQARERLAALRGFAETVADQLDTLAAREARDVEQ